MPADTPWTPTRPTRSSPKGERRRAEIIAAAFTHFSAHGYRGASMVQIAAACGVSRAGLLHHFPTKESLLAAVLEERDRVNGDLFFRDTDPKRDGIDYLRHLLQVLVHNEGQRELVRLFATLSTEASEPDHPAYAYIANRFRWLAHDIDEAMREAQSRGLVRPAADLDGFGRDLIALIDGLQIQWLVDPTGIDIAGRTHRRLMEVLIADPMM
ncbi:TetR/AcrR family transcriptional regulator [Agromyces bracchium]|uniref:TetR family transcriptional regulator n=1 Tax=Agromyces bracchium TaxID=88376 RepID=A0A6I3M9S5_9MICO|nr:TetR/AcrR family transcriptional regulator [Agromyces bracchium]MTH69955.1 TetR family transcriptional regulator [Agromyces bracchium]